MRIAYLGLAGCAVICGALWVERTEAASTTAPSEPAAPRPRTMSTKVVVPPSLVLDRGEEEAFDLDPEIDDDVMRGHSPIVDPAELAFVFSVGGESYVRLSTEAPEIEHGRGRLIHDAGVHAVVAPVATSAMPADLRAWAGRRVIVDGTCRARIIGFATVARVSGEPPGMYDEDREEREEPTTDPTWTREQIADNGDVVLAARLDGCSGTWARSEDYSPAAVAVAVQAPELQEAARRDLLARRAVDPTQETWIEGGGEGDWRDAAEVISHVYQHPLTDERWVFVQARHPGHCGEAAFDVMSAYRANDDGTVRRVADLSYGYDDIAQVVDLDGDGQPELILGSGDNAELVDLADERHSSISVPYSYEGCGC